MIIADFLSELSFVMCNELGERIRRAQAGANLRGTITLIFSQSRAEKSGQLSIKSNQHSQIFTNANDFAFKLMSFMFM